MCTHPHQVKGLPCPHLGCTQGTSGLRVILGGRSIYFYGDSHPIVHPDVTYVRSTLHPEEGWVYCWVVDVK